MLEAWLEWAVGMVWNYPVVGLCLFAGLFLTLRMLFIQLRCFPHAIGLISGRYDSPDDPGELTHFEALSAALSGTVGLGNIAGVAIAIAMGGPGAIFWMWVIAFFGMTTKYVECTLGIMHRKPDPATGKLVGGPMFYLTDGMGEKAKPLAYFFCLCLALGAFGAGDMFQSNQVASALQKYFNIPQWITGLALASLVAITIIGGIKRIGQVASRIVPLMCVIYLAGTILVCVLNLHLLPEVIHTILSDAFSGWAAAGGATGTVIITGVRRAVFSNEAGLGTAPMAHAVAKTRYPVREGIVASIGPFIDTFIVCSATAFVIILSGLFGTERFEAVSTLDLASAPGWALVKDELPASHETLRQFRGQADALRYQGGATPSVVETNIKTNEALRFSCYRAGGSPTVTLKHKDRPPIYLKVSPAGDARQGVSISACTGEPTWHSHIIEGDLSEVNELEFHGDGDWIVDRVQTVRPLEGVALTSEAFDSFFTGFGSIFIPLAVFLFCYSTMITWSYYGETAAAYLLGSWVVLPYKILFVAAAFLGAIFHLVPVLNFSDLMLGCMVIPNFIGVLYLSGEVRRQTREYFTQLRNGEFKTDKK